MSGREEEARIALGLPRLRPGVLARLLASSRVGEAVLYTAAAVTYIAAGVFVTELALSWIVGFAWLLLWVCGVPRLVRALRR